MCIIRELNVCGKTCSNSLLQKCSTTLRSTIYWITLTKSICDHSIRTANHKFPQQLFTAGCLLLQNLQLPALDFFDAVDDTYGIDPDGPLSLSEGSFIVPQSILRFSDADLHLLKQHINDPHGPSDNYSIY